MALARTVRSRVFAKLHFLQLILKPEMVFETIAAIADTVTSMTRAIPSLVVIRGNGWSGPCGCVSESPPAPARLRHLHDQ